MEMNEEYTKEQVASAPQLTEWKKEPSIMSLQEDFNMSKPARDELVQKIDRWNDLRNVTGSAAPKKIKNRSSVQPKLIRRQAEWRYAALSEPFLSADKLYDISPRTWEDKAGADQNSLLLEWQFNEKIDKVSFIDEYVRTTVDEGTAVVRVGWYRDTRIETKQVPAYAFQPVTDLLIIQQLQQAMALMQENPRGFSELPEEIQEAVHYTLETQTPVVAIPAGMTTVKEEVILENHPTLELVHYKNFYLDPSCGGDVDKANFAVLTFETSKAELLKDGRYKNLEYVLWNSNNPVGHPDHEADADQSHEFNDELRKRVVAHEYWGYSDIHGTGELVPIVATWIGNTIIRMEENPYPDKKIPFVLVPYMPVKRSTHGEPDAELLDENQAIIGALTRGMLDTMGRSANGQTGFMKGMLDTVNKRRFDAGMDYEYNGVGPHPTSGIHQHSFPELPASALNMVATQNADAEAMSGVKAFSGGLSGEAYGDVAAGIRGMLDASSKREMAILRRLAKGLMKIGKKIQAMNALFLSDEEVIRVTNEEFVTVKREDIQGNFDFKVDISTAEIDEAKAQDLAFMLQTMGNNMDLSMTQMILSEIAKLKRMPDLAKRILDFQPQPDPIQEQLKQLEVQKLQMEIAELQSKTQLNRAKARSEMAEADKADLDFVEQETGTKHAREMDKQSAQAQANQDLEISKALLAQNQKEGPKADIDAAVGWRQFSELLTNA